ncbi:MAG: hypothetical protein MJ151_00475 [Lachnospiraceae bacterium]|nr:hypothetical protein [Lachnospiraceae bacterium]
MMKAERNKTIDFELKDGMEYFNRCLSINKSVNIDEIINKTICGDLFEVIDNIPENSIDLIIADPPYNLDKNFHGNKFKKTSNDDYIEYTRSWIKKVAPLLKENGTIYVCCDWKCSGAIESVLKEFFIVQNA